MLQKTGHNDNNKIHHQQRYSHGHIPQQSSGQFLFDLQTINNANNQINPHIVNITNPLTHQGQMLGHVDDMTNQSQQLHQGQVQAQPQPQAQPQQPAHQQMNSLSTITIPPNLQNTQLTPEQVFALYQQQNNQIAATNHNPNPNPNPNQLTLNNNPSQIVYHAQHDNFYKIRVGTPQNIYPQSAKPYAMTSNNPNNPNDLNNPNAANKRKRKLHAQSLPNHHMDQAAKQYRYAKSQQPVMTNENDNQRNNLNFKDDSSNDSNKSTSTRITHSKSQSAHLYRHQQQNSDVNYSRYLRQNSPDASTSKTANNPFNQQFQHQMVPKGHSKDQSLRSVISNNSQQSHTTQHTKRTVSSEHEDSQGQDSYLPLSNQNSINSSKDNQNNPQQQELPAFSDRYESGKTANTDNSGDSDKDNLLKVGGNKNNLNLRIAVAIDHPDLPLGLPNYPSLVFIHKIKWHHEYIMICRTRFTNTYTTINIME